MSDIGSRIASLINAAGPGIVWTPSDFAPLGSRDVIDKTLQRMVTKATLRRIDRGLYDLPAANRLTRKATTTDYRAVIDAMARRDRLRLLVDGMTAANDLGLTDAVPARVTIHTDARLYAGLFGQGENADLTLSPGRYAWVHVVRGKLSVNGQELEAGDGAAATRWRDAARDAARRNADAFAHERRDRGAGVRAGGT